MTADHLVGDACQLHHLRWDRSTRIVEGLKAVEDPADLAAVVELEGGHRQLDDLVFAPVEPGRLGVEQHDKLGLALRWREDVAR